MTKTMTKTTKISLTRTVSDGEPAMLEITDREDGGVELRVYGTPGPQGGKGSLKGDVVFSKKEMLLDMIIKLWPDNVAYQFNTEEE